jgi:mannose-1-phosphate guanylyltransferase
MIQPIIIAGGSGTRLWPMSRKLYPKQYLALAGEMSMLQETLKRLEGLDANPPVLVCNEAQRFVAAEQMRRMGLEDVSIYAQDLQNGHGKWLSGHALYPGGQENLSDLS